jgi:hypothetical protein
LLIWILNQNATVRLPFRTFHFLHKQDFSVLNRILVVSAKRAAISPVSPRSTFHSTNGFKTEERHRRSKMKKFLTIVGLLTVVATPAFAQAYDPDNGTGNVIDVPALEQQAGRADATSAFAQAPEKNAHHKTRVDSRVDPYSSAVTGGGSEGYNWNLAHSNDY